MKSIWVVLVLAVFSAGCASLTDAPRKVIGISTRTLEHEKGASIYQSYDCDLSGCFSAVLEIADNARYHVFMKDQIRGLIVLMNIPGAVDTTEVGVFFTPDPKGRGVRVECSSRSSSAKRSVAQMLFGELSLRYRKI
jgi:hypothetical protein